MSTEYIPYRKIIITCSKCGRQEEVFQEWGKEVNFPGWYSPGGGWDYCPEHSKEAKSFFQKGDIKE